MKTAARLTAWKRTGCAVICLLMAACAARPIPTPRPADSPLAAAVPAGPAAEALEAAAQAYTDAGGRPVQVIVLGGDEYADQVAAALLAGLDRYDLLLLPAADLPHWTAYKALRPLQTPAEAADLAAWLPPLRVGADLYGLPTQPDAIVLWYRADLLEEAGLSVPRDWNAFRAAALALNQPPERYGAAISGSGPEAAQDFSALLAGFGGQAAGADFQVALDGEAARRALEFYAALRSPDGLVDPQAGSFTRADVIAALAEGRAALGLAPLSAAHALTDCESSPNSCRAGQPLLAWAWLPGVDPSTALGSLEAWAVPLHAAHPEEAQRFAAWLTGPEGARVWARNGGVPAHRSVLAEMDGLSALGQVEVYNLPLPPVTNNADGWSAYQAAVEAAVAGEQTPAAALKEAARRLGKDRPPSELKE